MMRSEKLRRLVAMLPCMCCGQKGQTQAAHANFQSFGKGMGIKASDAALMALCALPCGVRSRSDDDAGRAAQCAVRMDSEDVGGARGAGEGCGMKAERHQARNSSGECVLSQSDKAALMRVCQPGPEALKVSNTSKSKRTETSFLVGAFCAPRCPRNRLNSAMPLCGMAFDQYTSVAFASFALYGTSSKMSEVDFLLIFLSLSTGNHMNARVAICPDQDDDCSIQHAKTDQSLLAVVFSIVFAR